MLLSSGREGVLDAFKYVSDVTNITSNLAAAAPLIAVQVDPVKASHYGLSAQSIALTLGSLYNNVTVTTVNFNGQQMKVQLQMSANPPATVDDLNNQIVAVIPTELVKLSDVATVQQTLGPTQITHTGGQHTATVSAMATTDDVGAATAAINTQIKKLSLPSGVTVALSGVWLLDGASWLCGPFNANAAGFLRFFRRVMTTDMIGMSLGQAYLRAFFAQLARQGR